MGLNARKNKLNKKKVVPETLENPETKPSAEDYMKWKEIQKKTEEQLIKDMNDIYKIVKNLSKESEFQNYSYSQKFDKIADYGYKQIMNDHPVVTRYILNDNSFSNNAFKRYLNKIKNLYINAPAEKDKPKGYNEDIYCQQNAFYIRYLYEEMHKHASHQELNFIFNDSYKKLKSDFDEFRNKHEEIEKSTTEDLKKLSTSNVLDLCDRLKTKTQALSDNDTIELKKRLLDALYKTNFKKMKIQLLEKVPLVTTGPEEIYGLNTNLDEKHKIQMIETVDADKYEQVPAQYKTPHYNINKISDEYS